MDEKQVCSCITKTGHTNADADEAPQTAHMHMKRVHATCYTTHRYQVQRLGWRFCSACMCVQAQGSGQNPPPSHRGGGMTNRGGGGGTARMTPRVPNGGDVAPKMTPRMPQNGGRGNSTARGGTAGAEGPIVVRPEQVATLSRDVLRFLTKKLVHLTVLLEQDTVADDAKYPSFYSV